MTLCLPVLTCRQTMAARSACTSDFTASGSCTHFTRRHQDVQPTGHYAGLLTTVCPNLAHHVASSVDMPDASCVDASKTASAWRRFHLFQEAAQASDIPADNASRRSIKCWRPHRLLIQRPCRHWPHSSRVTSEHHVPTGHDLHQCVGACSASVPTHLVLLGCAVMIAECCIEAKATQPC